MSDGRRKRARELAAPEAILEREERQVVALERCAVAFERIATVSRPRYLVYDIDKHQSSPQFCDEPYEADYANADDYSTVIVDLDLRRRYFAGEWESVPLRGSRT